MGRRLIQGLEWLKSNNPDQLRWAAIYLATRGFLERHEHPDNRQFGQQLTYEELVRIGRRLQEQRALIKEMKAAWNQQKHRMKNDGRKTYTLTLKTTTKARLEELSRDSSMSAILESLIDKAYKARLRKEQKISGTTKQTLQGDRDNTLEDIRALLAGDSTPPDDSGATAQALTEISMDVPCHLERPQLLDDATDRPDEKTAELPQESVAVQANEAPLDQEGTDSPIPDPLHNSQVPAATADEAQPEQAAPADSSQKPSDAPPRDQSEAKLPEMKIRLKKKKTFAVPRANLPKSWDTDQSN